MTNTARKATNSESAAMMTMWCRKSFHTIRRNLWAKVTAKVRRAIRRKLVAVLWLKYQLESSLPLPRKYRLTKPPNNSSLSSIVMPMIATTVVSPVYSKVMKSSQKRKSKSQPVWGNERLAPLLAVKNQTKAARDNKNDL